MHICLERGIEIVKFIHLIKLYEYSDNILEYFQEIVGAELHKGYFIECLNTGQTIQAIEKRLN